MTLKMPDGSILMHGDQPYDPEAAREYYLRTRKLKGRTHGGVQTTAKPSASKMLTPAAKSKAAASHKTAAQKKAAVEARVASLNKKLDALRKVLAELVKQAKARSGVETPAPKTSAGAKTPTKDNGHQTAKEKKAAEDYYNKHKKDPKPDDPKSVEAKIADVTAQIKKLRKQIAAAKTNTKPVPVGAGTKTNK